MKDHPLLSGIEDVAPYEVVTGDSLYTIRAPAMQIEAFLPVASVVGMTSYPGVGKTWLAMEIARSVASGTPFLGRYTAQRGGVLFVGSDSSLHDYARQWARLTRHIPHAAEEFEPVRFLIQSGFMFEDEEQVRKLIATHRAFEWGEVDERGERNTGFHVIVFDTLSRLTRANQNDNTEMEQVFRNIRLIAEATDSAIVLLHHNSKRSEFNDGADWRGAMSQIGALDAWVQLQNRAKDKYLVGVQFKKFRGITPEDFSYRMHVSEGDEARIVISDEPVTTQQRLDHDPLADAVTKYVTENPDQRVIAIKAALWPTFSEGVATAGGSPIRFKDLTKFDQAIRNRLAKAMESGKIERTLNGEGKAVFRTVTPNEQA